MKIKDIDIGLIPDHIMEMHIYDLMAGENMLSSDVNRILKYLGFDDEEVICIGKMCSDCPYYNKQEDLCMKKFSDHVRSLIARRKRCNLEDML